MVVRSGEATFERFYEQHRDRVYRAVSVVLGEREAADATAEAFVRAYERWGSVGGHPNAIGWVVTTALNYQRSRWRRARLVPTRSSHDRAMPQEPLDAAIVAAVRGLPRRQREVVVLRFLCDLSTEQTASTLGIAPGTVTAHVHRAIETLRASLAELEEELQDG
jgi:RNA polymerase sigma-70 factor (ECF subfamily)